MLSRIDDLVQDYLSLARLAELRFEPMPLGAVVALSAQEMRKQCADRVLHTPPKRSPEPGAAVHLHQNAFRRCSLT